MLNNILRDRFYKFNKNYAVQFILELINSENMESLNDQNE
jgi:hypothetical protein